MKGLVFMLRTLRDEAGIALLTGLLTFGLCLLLTRAAWVAAAGFGLTAALVAGALDTLYFHLLFLQREGRVQAEEKRYLREIDDTKRRLSDGSLRLQEGLVRRFEEDFRRSRVKHPDSGGKRQLQAAKVRFKARLWVLDRVIAGNELHAGTTAAKNDLEILERWTERIDGLVDARLEVRRQENAWSSMFNRLRPGHLARQTRQTFTGWQASNRSALHLSTATPLADGDGSGTLRPS